MPPDALFAAIFTTDELARATSDEAWVEAMLAFEGALALAGADAGAVPREAADAIARCCGEIALDPAALGREGRATGNPVVPLVRALREALPAPAADWAHHGATSQDVIDTAAMLVARRSTAGILADLEGIAGAAARLAERHRTTLMAARTLLQQALPTTFALKACGWLGAATAAADGLARVRDERLAVQLGGAAGTLASLGSAAPAVVEALARRLDLRAPLLPWHTDRARVGELAAALAVAAGVAGKVAADVVLLAQGEVREVREAAGGASSAMPHKHNPVQAVAAAAAARRAPALAGVLLSSMVQEHERAAGAWQAEWETLGELLRAAGGAVAQVRELLDGLQVDASRMAENLAAAGDVLVAERVVEHLAPQRGRVAARAVVEEALARAMSSGGTLAGALVPGVLTQSDAGTLFDPGGWLGSADVLVERALAAWHARRGVAGEATA